MNILLVVHRETLHDYLYWASKWASCWLYTENLHPMHVTTNSFGAWVTYITSALERKLKSSPLLRSTCKNFFSSFLAFMQKQQPFDVRSALLFEVYSFSLAVACIQSISYTSRPIKRFQIKSKGCRDACVQHTGLYKAYKQEGTI